MKNNISIMAVFLFIMCVTLPAISWSSDLRAQMLANPCLSCHGPDTQSAGAIPPIVGMTAEHIKSALLAFKNDERTGTVMNRIAKGYTEEEIDALARYFTR